MRCFREMGRLGGKKGGSMVGKIGGEKAADAERAEEKRPREKRTAPAKKKVAKRARRWAGSRNERLGHTAQSAKAPRGVSFNTWLKEIYP
jgi:hypothetical protein